MRYCSKTLLIGLAVLAFSSCAADEDVSPVAGSDCICFGGSTIGWPDPDIDAPRSRAEKAPAGMGCYAFYNCNDEHAIIISNSEYTRNAAGIYTSYDVVYWPGSHATLDFYHYAPYGAAGLDFDPTYGSSSFSYTIPEAQSDRCDLLLASTPGVDGGLNAAKDITLKHALTAVGINIAENMGSITVKDIKFTGLHCSGTATFDADGNVQWAADGAGSGEFSFAVGRQNYLIPQALDGAMMTINMIRDGKDLSITAPLKTQAYPAWKPGTVVNYKLKIVPIFEFDVAKNIDAHYVLCPATVHVDRLAADRNWTLTASASDGADVSVQKLSEVNSFVKQGYWTDKYMNNGVETAESARGSATTTGKGNGNFDLMVFVPENAGKSDRTITLKITADDTGETLATHSFNQYCPDWNYGGWERIDDGMMGMYGFYYTTKHVYVYNNSRLLESGQNSSVRATNDLVAKYNATDYTTVKTYSFEKFNSDLHWGSTTQWRFYVEIDYSKLNTLNGKAQSEIDGWENTLALFLHGGSGVTQTFETALQAMRRREDTSQLAFRRRTSGSGPGSDPWTFENGNDPDVVPLEIEGANLTGNQALALVLKKNRYDINRVDDSELGTTSSPKLDESDLAWYMPAVSEFNKFGAWVKGTTHPGQIWSSTAVGDARHAKSGANVQYERTNSTLYVRARRAPLGKVPAYTSKTAAPKNKLGVS